MSAASTIPDSRPPIRVACGVLQRASGEVLLAQRPVGKIAAGCWEFPGGKIEDGEAGIDALRRELDEELGVRVRRARPLIRFRHDYSHRSVLLKTWLVTDFDGEPQPRERQALRWVPPAALAAWPQALPTVAPIVRALSLPTHYVFTPPDATADEILAGLTKLPRGALLRLRQPALSTDAYFRCASRLAPQVADLGLRFVLDREPQMAADLGAGGWHIPERRLRLLASRPQLSPAIVQIASVHDSACLQRAQRIGLDAAVLGPVHATPSHPGLAGMSWSGFADARGHAAVPVYAIGGLGQRSLPDAFGAWAQGIAGISSFWR